MIESHVLFTLLTYSLIQLYLMKKHLTELANKTIESLKADERLGKDCVVLYYDNKFAVLDLDYHTELVACMEKGAREKLVKWIQKSRKKWEVGDEQKE